MHKLIERLTSGISKKTEHRQLQEKLNKADPVAERSRNNLLKYGLYVVLGLYLFVAGAIVYIGEDSFGAVRAAMIAVVGLGIFFTALGIVQIRFFAESPKAPILTDGEYVYLFSRGWHAVLISDITLVRLSVFDRFKGDGSDGTLIVYANEARFRVLNVRAAGETKARLGY